MLLIPLALSASVQPEERRGFRGERDGRHGPGGILRELDLSETQREQLRSLREQDRARETMARLMQSRRALNEAVESGADEGTLRQLAFQTGEAEGDAAVERARSHQQMMEILTPEQREQYEALRQEQKQKMEERRKRFQQRMSNRRDPEPGSF
jgi:Spy/CpxP family protein refolding chaperone